MIENRGSIISGGNNTISQIVSGENAIGNIGHDTSRDSVSGSRRMWDVGIITILAEEARAVQDVLGLEWDAEHTARQPFYTGKVPASGRSVRVVAARTLQQGQGSVVPTLDNLRQCYNPAVFVLLGIAGGIHRDLALDDVVVATRVVFYDMRQVKSGNVLHRGEEYQSPAWMAHAVNSFFTRNGDPAKLSAHELGGRESFFRVFSGPIGSGNAVVADGEDEIRTYLSTYNEKILAVETEAGGLGQFCHETSSASGAVPGWVVIRGISDHADRAKNDDHHVPSAKNAANTLRELIPYITTAVNREPRGPDGIGGRFPH